jgi:amylosucrase
MRIAGTLASLAGLELAIENDCEEEKERGIGRMLLLQSITLSIGGIPLIYLGEEWGMLNDYEFVKDPAKAGDTRWIHRPKMQWEFLSELDDKIESGGGSIRKRIFRSLQRMIAARKSQSAFAGQVMELITTGNHHVLSFVRINGGNRVIVIGNFSEEPQTIIGNHLRTAGLGRFFQDAISGRNYGTSEDIQLEPYQYLWLCRV